VAISAAVTEDVVQRARYRCEYCQVYSWPLTIDHVVPRFRGGGDEPSNLAAACFPCNRLKWARTDAVDPLTDSAVPLFNPRLDNWDHYFVWSVDFLDIHGRTAIGRATAALLRFQRADRRRHRQVLRTAARSGT